MLDPDIGELSHDAQVAEILAYTALTRRRKSEQVTARLIVRLVVTWPNPPPKVSRANCSRLALPPVLHHSPFQNLHAEGQHRHHAVIEIIADGEAGPLPHLPCGHFNANAPGWCCGRSRSTCYAPPLGLPRQNHHRHHPRPPVNVPARLARSARRLLLHPPATGPGLMHGCTCSPPSTPLPTAFELPLSTAQAGPTGTEHVEKLGRPAGQPRPQGTANSTDLTGTTERSTSNHHRWIEA